MDSKYASFRATQSSVVVETLSEFPVFLPTCFIEALQDVKNPEKGLSR